MRPCALLGLSVLASAATTPPTTSDHDQVIEVEGGREYTVKLKCAECPLRAWTSPHKAEWVHPPPESSLLLEFVLDEFNDALLLNGQRIFPLDPMPLDINAKQAITEVEQDETESGSEDVANPNRHSRILFPLQYEHTIFRADKPELWWLQFNVTGLPWGETADPIKLGQKAVQILIRREYDVNLIGGYILSIEDVQIVSTKDKAQPPRMKCGKLAMVQTTFDPREWDEYGKLGTMSRAWNAFVGRIRVGKDALLLPLLALLAVSLVIARRLFIQRQQEKAGTVSEAETALLGRDAPPPYADIPVIKIEEYD
ncbi:hypothetical protein BKA58DRAFT_171611 [Alternaria rosae]|uniref:uncharacterized protein n=1 Tax=Alternaria rosae TaxID=1187941 RepID=UPI001E8D346C|nr:uncharacterized protein BKA58DRAFT_171611 [Alternaria rosae]KAH6870118.1 hypothetical protein BKA58DRAFT_171611 [Alternaria rosae]